MPVIGPQSTATGRFLKTASPQRSMKWKPKDLLKAIKVSSTLPTSPKQRGRRGFIPRNQPQRGQTQNLVDITESKHPAGSVDFLDHDSKSESQPRWFSSYCPPPPHAGKDWITHCLSEKPSLNQLSHNGHVGFSSLGLPASIPLFICIALGLVGVFIWASCLVHTCRYINKHRVHSPDQHPSGHLGNFSFRFVQPKRFNKNRLRKGIMQGWLQVDETHRGSFQGMEQEKNPLWISHNGEIDNEKGYTNLSDYLDSDFDCEGQHGKPAQQILFDGLIGSIKGGALIRRALGRATLKTKRLGEGIWGKGAEARHRHDQPHEVFESKKEEGAKYHFHSNEHCGQSFHSTPSASGVDMAWESGEASLSLRRDALVRQALKKEPKKNFNFGHGALSLQPQSHCSITEISIAKDENNEAGDNY